ncbi:MAG: Gfo/Idh/MocA family oxidoreductase, partial [Pirellulaceae bacterium]
MTATINIGLIGAGWFGREAHLANLLKIEDTRVIAASSRSDESLQQVQAMAGNSIETFTDWQRVLEIDAIDAVVIALTNDQHHAAAMAALAAGKHVLCEKPLGLTISECNEIIAASTAANRVLQVGHEMRFQRMYQEMKSMIDQGQLGNLHLMWCREFRGP